MMMTIIGVWWHEAFGLNSLETGCSAIVIGIGNLCGFSLNLLLTDKLGARKAMVLATCTAILSYAAVCLLELCDFLVLPVALAATFLVFAFAEFGFLGP